jgi:hypothetical protein
VSVQKGEGCLSVPHEQLVGAWLAGGFRKVICYSHAALEQLLTPMQESPGKSIFCYSHAALEQLLTPMQESPGKSMKRLKHFARDKVKIVN